MTDKTSEAHASITLDGIRIEHLTDQDDETQFLIFTGDDFEDYERWHACTYYHKHQVLSGEEDGWDFERLGEQPYRLYRLPSGP